ncbi:uncharacterized protein FA14DRAFT_161422 [Meira miltonrushii]|uniref:Uncharacterized protein n=1 Tax=Meira miltonrushii TaxID=1280837 RepID=A0A316V9H4_9BASI|nr:uncharacterized protein FA14DRAFT_161422 [Meira miltonrushii]PWN33698.1 hypothetical protein FA14DRAFT_161422 [Meira miltonrushii]
MSVIKSPPLYIIQRAKFSITVIPTNRAIVVSVPEYEPRRSNNVTSLFHSPSSHKNGLHNFPSFSIVSP